MLATCGDVSFRTLLRTVFHGGHFSKGSPSSETTKVRNGSVIGICNERGNTQNSVIAEACFQHHCQPQTDTANLEHLEH